MHGKGLHATAPLPQPRNIDMVWLKRLGMVVLVLVAVLAALAAYTVWRSLPQLNGARTVPGLEAAVLVQRDAADVTHITAEDPRDAWFALGYVHAQERAWQLELNRRTTRGELSTLFGPATLSTDLLVRTLDLMSAARRQLANLPQEAHAALQAYADGINALHDHGDQWLSPEFHAMGARPGRWLPEDSVAWSLLMALDLGGNWGTEFARLRALEVLDTQRMWQLLPPADGAEPVSRTDFARLYAGLGVYRQGSGRYTPPSAPPRPAPGPMQPRLYEVKAAPDGVWQAQWRRWSQAYVAQAGTPGGKGSNSWIVAGSHSASGMPLLANDPHLGLNAPSLWYMARLRAPGLDVIGASMPGLPFIVLGRTAGVAWGFTNTGPDVQDLYLEQLDPTDPRRYRTPDGWAHFTERSVRIEVKGHPDIVTTLRASRHGPVLSDIQIQYRDLLDLDRYAVALRWSALDPDNRTVYAGLNMNQAQDVDQFIAAGADYHSPMQTVVMADTTGKVAYKAMGKAPLRRDDNDIRGLAPAPGWHARYDWDGWLPYADNPGGDAGEQGWVAMANQGLVPPDHPQFIGQDWAEPYRHDRIAALLDNHRAHDLAGMRAIQADQLSLSAVQLLSYLRAARTDHPLAAAARRELAEFDGTMRADAAAPLIFTAWIDELTRGLLAPRLGTARFASLYGKRQFRPTVERILADNDTWWCAPLSCAEQTGAALSRALERLQQAYGADVASWRWGAAHPSLSVHRPFGQVPGLARVFDIAVPVGGDGQTVNAAQYWLEGEQPYASRHGAGLRLLFDLADLEASRYILHTGQSGVVYSRRYRDMRDEWAAVVDRPLRLQPEQFRHTLTLEP